MSSSAPKTKLDRIFATLIGLPLVCLSVDEALKKLTELCRAALNSQACTLVWVDLEQRVLTQVACAGFDAAFETFMAQHKIKIGTPDEGVSMDYDQIVKGEVIKKYNLPVDGGGVADPEVAKKYGLESAMCYPLKMDDRLIGSLNHFSSTNKTFTAKEESLLGLFARQAENISKQFKNEVSLKVTKNLVSDLLTLSPEEFLRQLPNRAGDLVPDAVCLVWKLAAEQGKLQIVAASDSVDEEYRGIALDYSNKKSLLRNRKARYLRNVASSRRYNHPAEALARGWVSLLSVPMWEGDELIGLLDVYTKFEHHFKDSERDLFEELATLTALSIQKAELQRESSETLVHRRRLEAINRAMTAMAESRTIDKVLMILLRKSLELVGAKWGCIRRVNPSSRKLEVTSMLGTPDTPRALEYGKGIAWKAIIERSPQIANDVRSDVWKGVFEEFSSETRSELAVPLLIDRVRVCEGTSIKLRSQLIGVLSLESPRISAFSKKHISYLLPLVRQAALLIDWLEAEQKLSGLRDVEREIVGKKNWRDVLQTVVTGIRDTLGFEYVDVSLVDAARNVIRSEYVVGMPSDAIDRFKKMTDHSLDGNDIHADIVRTRMVEVPANIDPRFDPYIFEQFGHENLIRVFIPMIAPSTGEVIGTVEAGYRRDYRDLIYERDVQFLQSFVAYVVEAIEPSKRALIETISHELRSSIVGIRSNADYLRQLWPELSGEKIDNKLVDTLADCDILLSNVGELEYFLGRTPQAPKVEPTLVMRDIVIKTVNQLTPMVRERRFDPRRIEYSLANTRRIKIYVERAKFNQVVANLLSNSIKYAEDDPGRFSIQIGVDERPDKFILSFADWGMGIRSGLEEKIFQYAFRTPEAKAKNVSGSGLGLTIARDRMREMGGDLIVANNCKPTEFHLLIPKKLMEAPK